MSVDLKSKPKPKMSPPRASQEIAPIHIPVSACTHAGFRA